jgi:hypothetical protein
VGRALVCCVVGGGGGGGGHGDELRVPNLYSIVPYSAQPYLYTLTLIKKGNKIFLIYKGIQKGAVSKSYMTNGLFVYD